MGIFKHQAFLSGMLHPPFIFVGLRAELHVDGVAQIKLVFQHIGYRIPRPAIRALGIQSHMGHAILMQADFMFLGLELGLRRLKKCDFVNRPILPNLISRIHIPAIWLKFSAHRRHWGLGRAPASAFVIQMLCLRQRRHRRRDPLHRSARTICQGTGRRRKDLNQCPNRVNITPTYEPDVRPLLLLLVCCPPPAGTAESLS